MTRTATRRHRGHAIGGALWWSAVVVVAPPAATVTSGLVAGLPGTCHPATPLECLLTWWVPAAVAVPVTVVGGLRLGARALARDRRVPSAGARMLRAHGAVVAVLVAASGAAVVATRLDDHGSVGSALLLGVGGMPLLDLGLPWSLTHLPSLRLPGGWGDVGDRVTTVVAAVLNVVLHAALRWTWRRRDAPPAVAEPGPRRPARSD